MNQYDEWCQEDDQDEKEPEIVTYLPGTVFLNVYEIDRACGGPEDGGWWYTTGELVRCLQVPDSLAEAYREMLFKEFPATGKAGNVNYGGGDHIIRYDSEPGEEYFPKETPHYE